MVNSQIWMIFCLFQIGKINFSFYLCAHVSYKAKYSFGSNIYFQGYKSKFVWKKPKEGRFDTSMHNFPICLDVCGFMILYKYQKITREECIKCIDLKVQYSSVLPLIKYNELRRDIIKPEPFMVFRDTFRLTCITILL